jgi:hypothetical protein
MAATEVGETLAGRKRSKNAEVAQLVEQPIRNRQVGGSSPPLGSIPLISNTLSIKRK